MFLLLIKSLCSETICLKARFIIRLHLGLILLILKLTPIAIIRVTSLGILFPDRLLLILLLLLIRLLVRLLLVNLLTESHIILHAKTLRTRWKHTGRILRRHTSLMRLSLVHF